MIDREWTQDELKAHLLAMGFQPEDLIESGEIPQGVKYISNTPLTEADIARAKQLIAENPGWEWNAQT